MSAELEKRLDANKYDVYGALKTLFGHLQSRKDDYCLCKWIRGKCWFCRMLKPAAEVINAIEKG